MAATKYAFSKGSREHGVGEVGGDDASGADFPKGESQIAGATAEVKDERVGALEDGAQEFSGASAPKTVEMDGEDVVEGVVGRRDVGEHFADFAGGVGLGGSALGAGAGGVRGAVSHGACQKA